MHKGLLLLIFTFLTVSTALGQSRYDLNGRLYTAPNNKSVDIQYVEINNELLLKQIRQFINEQSDSSTFFKQGFGFIVVSDFKAYPYGAKLIKDLDKHSKDTIYQFNIATGSYVLNTTSSYSAFYCESCFPAHYSTVNGRLILFQNSTTNWLIGGVYSQKSKEILAKLVKKCLAKALEPSFIFYDFPDRKPYTLSPDRRKSMSEQEILENAWFVLNAGKKVTLHFDGSVTYSY